MGRIIRFQCLRETIQYLKIKGVDLMANRRRDPYDALHDCELARVHLLADNGMGGRKRKRIMEVIDYLSNLAIVRYEREITIPS